MRPIAPHPHQPVATPELPRRLRRTTAVALALTLLLSGAATTLTALAGVITAAPAAAAPAGTVTPHLIDGYGPAAITTGPDGNLWVAERASRAILRMAPDGTILNLLTNPGITDPTAIVTGPDGNVWFTNGSGGPAAFGRITPAGAVTTYPLDTSTPDGSNAGHLAGLVVGPDGDLWALDGGVCVGTAGCGGSGVVHISVADGSASYVTPLRDDTLHQLVSGPGGDLWFNGWSGTTLNRLTVTGTLTTLTPPQSSAGAQLWFIAAGPDGNLWYSQSDGTVGRVDPAGNVASFPVPGVTTGGPLVAGPDGDLWFAPTDHTVVRIATDGTVDGTIVTPSTRPLRLDTGPGGDVWYPQARSATQSEALVHLAADGTASVHPTTRFTIPATIAVDGTGAPWYLGAAPGPLYRVVDPDHVETILSLPPPAGGLPYRELTADPGGGVWLVEPAGSRPGQTDDDLARIDGTGALTRFAVPVGAPPTGGGQSLGRVAVGGDGTAWFTWSAGSVGGLGRVGSDGVAQIVTTGPPLDTLAVFPDGRIWSSSSDGVVATVVARNPDGTVAESWDLPADHRPEALAPSGSGALFRYGLTGDPWIGPIGSSVAHLAPDGTVTERNARPTQHLVPAADGRVWAVAQYSVNLCRVGDTCIGADIQRIDDDGTVTDVTASLSGATSPTAAPDGDVWLVDTGRAAIVSVGTGVEPPGAAASVSAVPGARDGAVDVAWSAPASDGGRPLTGYRVTASPGGATCDATPPTTGCTVEDLVAGVDYTFTVTATNAGGLSSTSDPAGPVQPPRAPGSGYTPVSPLRVGDTRVGSNVGFTPGPITEGTSKSLPVAGVGGVPVSARAVVATVTVTNPTAASYLTAYPTGAAVPGTANLLFAPGQTVAQAVTIPVGPDGDVSFFNQLGDVDVVVDLTGYYDDGTTPAGRLNATTPTRVLDSRTTDTTTNGPGQWNGQPLGPDQTRTLSLAGTVPATATAAVVNLTVTAGSDPSYLRALPGGAAPPETATVLFAPGQTITTLTTVGLGPDQTIDLYNQHGNVHVVADLVGWYDPTTGDLFHPITPRRLHDTRTTTPLDPAETRTLPATVDDLDTPALPADATALVGTLTATAGTDPSYLTAGPTPLPNPPGTASLLFAAGQTIPNAITTGLSPTHTLDLYNQTGTVHAILDVTGYWSST